MRARVQRDRIQILFDDPDEDVWLRQREIVCELIGSANLPKDEKLPLVSCKLSVQNFQKLGRFKCKLHDDPHTRKVVARLRAERDLYDAESKRGHEAKNGVELFSGYSFKEKPFAHQVLGFQFLHAMREPALFGGCGVGKTFITITYGDSLVKAGEQWWFLVACPVNLIKHVWASDIGKFTDASCVGLREPTVISTRGEDWDDPDDPSYEPGRAYIQARAALRTSRKKDPKWRAKAKRQGQARHRKLLNARFEQDVDFYIINFENLRTDAKEKRVRNLLQRKQRAGFHCCLIIDESSKIKSSSSRTYKALKRLRGLCERCIIMTGTPSPNGLLDLWAQFMLLDGGKTLQPSLTDYRHDTCDEITLKGVTWEDRQGNKHNIKKWSPRHGAALQVHKTLEPHMIRFRTEDCIDLPPQRFLTRHVEMSQGQTEAYEDMENMLFTELEGEPVTARVAVTKLLKLRQITGGFLMTDEEKPIPIGKDSPKMLELDELLGQSIGKKLGDEGPPVKGIVWAQYKWECRSLMKRYKKEYGVRGLFGGISSGARDQAIHRFQTDDKCCLLVCHPGSAGHGLNFTEASYSFYYSLSYNFEEYYQSYRRITRPGQKRKMTFYFLVCPGTIDEELIDVVIQKKNLSDLITDGKFDRNDFIRNRGKDRAAQLRMDWGIPDETTTETGGRGSAGSNHAGMPGQGNFDW